MSQNLIHVHEGIVLGHARCYLEGDDCRGIVETVVDPYALELDGVEELIDTCQRHLDERYLAI